MKTFIKIIEETKEILKSDNKDLNTFCHRLETYKQSNHNYLLNQLEKETKEGDLKQYLESLNNNHKLIRDYIETFYLKDLEFIKEHFLKCNKLKHKNFNDVNLTNYLINQYYTMTIFQLKEIKQQNKPLYRLSFKYIDSKEYLIETIPITNKNNKFKCDECKELKENSKKFYSTIRKYYNYQSITTEQTKEGYKQISSLFLCENCIDRELIKYFEVY